MTEQKYITASCIISNHLVRKNGKNIFENNELSTFGFLSAIYQFFDFNYPRFYKMDGLSKLGWLASEILLSGSFEQRKYSAGQVGIVLSNANASLDTDIKYIETLKDIPSPSVFVYTLPNIVIGEISIRNNFKGENAFFITERFDEDFMERYVSMLMNSAILEACICGWVEFLSHEYKAVLFLVEKNKSEHVCLFTQENINKIFQIDNQ